MKDTIAGPDPKDVTSIQKQFTPIKLNNDFKMNKLKIGIAKVYITIIT